MKVRSATFEHGGDIPQSMVFNGMGQNGKNRSPHLELMDVPEGTKSLAIVMHDPDAPTSGGFYHWVVFNIPGDVREIAEGNAPGTHGHTDFGIKNYGGPAPPPGPAHRYNLTVYALDTEQLPIDDSTTGAKLEFMVAQHALAKGSITGHYKAS